MTEEQGASQGQASQGASSQTQEAAKTQEAAPLTAEKVQQMIAEATKKAVDEAKEVGRRELQSQQDRNKAEVESLQRRARLAEGTLGRTATQVQSLDPEVAKEIELAKLRAEKQESEALNQEYAVRQQQEAYAKTLTDSLNSHLTNLGIDPKDTRIDWAEDAPDYFSGRSRFDASVAKIMKAQQKEVTSPLEKRLKELEDLVKQAHIEVNSVPAGTPTGTVSGSDAEFVQKFGAGELPMSKANIDRYDKIRRTY